MMYNTFIKFEDDEAMNKVALMLSMKENEYKGDYYTFSWTLGFVDKVISVYSGLDEHCRILSFLRNEVRYGYEWDVEKRA